ncbi:MAG: hypothetical protein ACJ8FA_09325 [Xanthobacteraceae bacterium]|jgi:hypothetical protein
MPRINEQALKKELAKRGFESVSIRRELPGRRLEVDANKLYPVHVEGGEAIYAPVPMSLSVELDARGHIISIDRDTPDPAAVADAAQYVKALRDSGQLTAPGEREPVSGITHRIERDEQGRKVLRRKRFSISGD